MTTALNVEPVHPAQRHLLDPPLTEFYFRGFGSAVGVMDGSRAPFPARHFYEVGRLAFEIFEPTRESGTSAVSGLIDDELEVQRSCFLDARIAKCRTLW